MVFEDWCGAMIFLWVFLYGFTYTLSDTIAQYWHMEQTVTPVAMLLYMVGFIHWIIKSGWYQEIRFCRITIHALKENMFFLPLTALPVWNLLSSQNPDLRLSTGMLMLAVSMCEELFFRGFLLYWLERKNLILGVVGSSAVFALFHCVNMTSLELSYVAMQILCAFSAGVCYCFVAIKGNSLFPTMLAHFLTNLTAPAEISSADGSMATPGLWICVCIYLGYGIWLNRRKKESRG